MVPIIRQLGVEIDRPILAINALGARSVLFWSFAASGALPGDIRHSRALIDQPRHDE